MIGKRLNTPSMRQHKNKVVVEIVDWVENGGIMVMNTLLVRVMEFGDMSGGIDLTIL